MTRLYQPGKTSLFFFEKKKKTKQNWARLLLKHI